MAYSRDDGVVPVMGTAILIGVVVIMAIGIWIFVNRINEAADTSDSPEFASFEAQDAPNALTAGTADALVVVEHRGGGAVDTSLYEFTVGGASVAVKAHDGSSCTAIDVTVWSSGQTVCLVEAGTNVAGGDVEVLITHKSSGTISLERSVRIA